MKVDLIDNMGSDLTVVNAARVSFAKHHERFIDKDEKLIAYLAKHNHWTPFGHPQIQFRISAPIFVARQLVKHQIGLVWNEMSRRYVDDTPICYIPDKWRKRAENKKQGSSEEFAPLTSNDTQYIIDTHMNAIGLYERLIGKGVAPEQARMVLPQSTYTEWYWTGSLYAFIRVCILRTSDDAQKETRDIAEQISCIIKDLYPISYKYLLKE